MTLRGDIWTERRRVAPERETLKMCFRRPLWVSLLVDLPGLMTQCCSSCRRWFARHFWKTLSLFLPCHKTKLFLAFFQPSSQKNGFPCLVFGLHCKKWNVDVLKWLGFWVLYFILSAFIFSVCLAWFVFQLFGFPLYSTLPSCFILQKVICGSLKWLESVRLKCVHVTLLFT